MADNSRNYGSRFSSNPRNNNTNSFLNRAQDNSQHGGSTVPNNSNFNRFGAVMGPGSQGSIGAASAAPPYPNYGPGSVGSGPGSCSSSASGGGGKWQDAKMDEKIHSRFGRGAGRGGKPKPKTKASKKKGKGRGAGAVAGAVAGAAGVSGDIRRRARVAVGGSALNNEIFDWNKKTDDEMIGYLCNQLSNVKGLSLLKCLWLFEKHNKPINTLIDAIDSICDDNENNDNNNGNENDNKNDNNNNNNSKESVSRISKETQQLFQHCCGIVNCMNPYLSNETGYSYRQGFLMCLLYSILTGNNNNNDNDSDNEDEGDGSGHGTFEVNPSLLFEISKNFEEKQRKTQRLQQLAGQDSNSNMSNISDILSFIYKEEESLNPGNTYDQLANDMKDILDSYKKNCRNLEMKMIKEKKENEQNNKRLKSIGVDIKIAEKKLVQQFEECERLLEEKRSLESKLGINDNKEDDTSEKRLKLEEYKRNIAQLEYQLKQLNTYKDSNKYHIGGLKSKYEKIQRNNFQNWDASEIVLFLQNELKNDENIIIDFNSLRINMVDDNVTGTHLKTIDTNDLRGWGIQDYGSRKAILKLIEQLVSGNNGNSNNNDINNSDHCPGMNASPYSAEGQVETKEGF